MLKKEEKVISTAESYYSDLISIILSVGVLYSSYIEMLLTHMFLTEYDKDTIIYLNFGDITQIKKLFLN